MIQTNLIVKFAVIVLIGILGFFFVSKSPSGPNGKITGLDSFLSITGFFIFLGAIGAFVILIGRQRKPMTNDASRNWEHERLKGKKAFVIDFVLKMAVPLLIVSSLFILNDISAGKPFVESLMNFGILFVVLTGLGFFAAHRYWNYLEDEFALKNSAENSEKKPD